MLPRVRDGRGSQKADVTLPASRAGTGSRLRGTRRSSGLLRDRCTASARVSFPALHRTQQVPAHRWRIQSAAPSRGSYISAANAFPNSPLAGIGGFFASRQGQLFFGSGLCFFGLVSLGLGTRPSFRNGRGSGFDHQFVHRLTDRTGDRRFDRSHCGSDRVSATTLIKRPGVAFSGG